MEGKIKVTTGELTSAATSFGKRATNMNSLATDMFTTVTNLTKQIWTGSAAEAYNKKFSGLSKDVDKLTKMINEHVSDLNEMASIYEKAEQEAEKKISALKSTVIE